MYNHAKSADGMPANINKNKLLQFHLRIFSSDQTYIILYFNFLDMSFFLLNHSKAKDTPSSYNGNFSTFHYLFCLDFFEVSRRNKIFRVYIQLVGCGDFVFRAT